MNSKSFSIGIVCGGPSPERGISLNSARSLMDHLNAMGFTVKVFYINTNLEFFLIDRGQLYSNTPSDFDFKLKRNGKKLNDYVKELKTVDIVFPVIHGKYGEDGTLQKILEENYIPLVGSSSDSCKKIFNKGNVNKVLGENGFDKTNLITIEVSNPDWTAIASFLQGKKKVIVKPNASGSSICVSIAENLDEIMEALYSMRKIDDKAVIEEFCEGDEFTVIVLQNSSPVPLVPTQIEVLSENKLFDYRKKYLPTNSTRWFCPPKFSNEVTKRIMESAEKIFEIFKMNDFVRIDGWLLDNGRLVFSDINPISGLEQNSFIFQQAAWAGMTHRAVLEVILRSACARHKINLSPKKSSEGSKKVYVLFGGNSAERQVSLMSGTNVWLKLLSSKIFKPIPLLLDGDEVWYLPYQYTMNHTVEEIKYNCEHGKKIIESLELYARKIQNELCLEKVLPSESPEKLPLQRFLDKVKVEGSFVFLGLHGEIGEDGTIQRLLEENQIAYNGSNSATSHLCMNKYKTGKVFVEGLELLPKVLCRVEKGKFVADDREVTFDILTQKLSNAKFIIKPSSDGCSAGVAKIQSQDDLDSYIEAICSFKSFIPARTLPDQENIVELPQNAYLKEYVIEPFIVVDTIKAIEDQLLIEERTGWVEITVGVLEKQGKYHSLSPSISLAENAILSVEEKFQGGTGINLTPPPDEIISSNQIEFIKEKIELIGKVFRLKNYARLDLFFNRISNKIILIEINTLPALTPSTVIFHQALSEKPPLYPVEFIEFLISNRLLD